MCLDFVYDEEKKEKWMNSQPETIITYKVVRIWENKLIPMYYYTSSFSFFFFRKHNEIKENDLKTKEKVNIFGKKGFLQTEYRPYFHFFQKKEDTEEYREYNYCKKDTKIIKCKINKKDITDIGIQSDKVVIVAKAFTIDDPEAKKYLD